MIYVEVTVESVGMIKKLAANYQISYLQYSFLKILKLPNMFFLSFFP